MYIYNSLSFKYVTKLILMTSDRLYLFIYVFNKNILLLDQLEQPSVLGKVFTRW